MTSLLADLPDSLRTFFHPQLEQLGMRETPAGFGGRAVLPADVGEGYLWVAGLGPHCLLSVHDFTLNEEVPLMEYPTDSFAISLMTANMAELAPVPRFTAREEENVVAFHQREGEVRFTMPARSHCRSTTFCFTPEYFERAEAVAGIDPDRLKGSFERIAPGTEPPEMRACLRAIRPNPQGGDAAALRCASLALEALSLMAAPRKETPASLRDRELAGRAVGIMRERLGERITLDDLASELFVSKSKLCKAFRSAEGKGVAEKLAQLRMERATHLLVRSDMPVGEIAAKVGFAHQSSFCEAYRRHCGMTPTCARRLDATKVDHG